MISCIDSHIKIGLVKVFFSFFLILYMIFSVREQQEWAYPTVQVSWVLMVTTGAHQPGCSPTGPEQDGVAIVAGSTSSLVSQGDDLDPGSPAGREQQGMAQKQGYGIGPMPIQGTGYKATTFVSLESLQENQSLNQGSWRQGWGQAQL